MSSRSQADRARKKAHRSTRVYRSSTMPDSSTKPTNQADAISLPDEQDYFNYKPVAGSRKRSRFQRSHAPDPLQLHPNSTSPLSAGPAGYKYTPLFLRTPDLESLRYDHGVQYKKRLSLKEVVLYARWHLLLDEDALPSRIKDNSKKSLEAVKKLVGCTIRHCGESWSGFWGRDKQHTSSSQTGVKDTASGSDSHSCL